MPVSVTKPAPRAILARNSWTREVFRATLTVPAQDATVPRALTAWTFHIVTGPEALSAPYSATAAQALTRANSRKDSSR